VHAGAELKDIIGDDHEGVFYSAMADTLEIE
jgi:hypothetical protein